MIGETILHYRILEKLGEGGMGVVYKAEDLKLKRIVAIKFLPRYISANKEERKRFEVEAQAAASLNHSNITTIYSIEETDDQSFIVMEYIDGKELKSLVEAFHPESGEVSLQLNNVINYAIQIAEGMEAAHKKGIVHRDIKSANIMVTSDGRTKIMDFGLAKIGEGTQLTKLGSTVGTISYMSPEQATGGEADHRSDIWSFGVVLYEILTGRLPFKGDYDQVIIYSILNEEPDLSPLTQKNYPSGLINIINKCLRRDLNARYQSVTELLNDLRILQRDPDAQLALTSKEIPKISAKNDVKNKRRFFIPGIVISLIILIFLIPPAREYLLSLFTSAPDSSEKHLLILPLTNIGGGPGKKAFCDGLMETMSSNLTQIEQFQGSLWVVPASEVVQNKINSVSEAYKMFGVNLVVTGSMQFMNNILRLTLNLVDAKNLRQLNSSIIDIGSKDISSTQDKAVIKLLQMLHIEMDPELKDILDAGKTSVPEAYEYYVQGRGNLQRYENVDNVEQAVNLFERAAENDTNYALAYAGLGEAYWREYELTKKSELVSQAVNNAKKAFKLDSTLAPINVTLGMIYLGTGDHELAIEHFKRALSNEPSDAAAFRGLAKAYEASDNITEAESTFKRAIALKPDYWAGYNDLGVFYYRHSRYDDAIAGFKQVIKLTPDNYRGYNNLGGIYYMLEKWSDAREMFEQSLKIRKSYNTYSNLGTLYYIEGKYSEAAQMYEQALKLNDNDYLTWGNLAAAYFWIPGKHDDAIETYKKTITLAEKNLKINDDPETASNLASYYAEVGDTIKALALLKKSLSAAPGDVMVMYRAATTYEHFGNRVKALYWISKAIENGYSRSEIEHQPELKNLIADERYKQIASGKNK